MPEPTITEAELQKQAMFKGQSFHIDHDCYTGLDTETVHDWLTHYFNSDMQEIGQVSVWNDKIGIPFDPPRVWDQYFLKRCKIEPVSRIYTIGFTPPEVIEFCLPDYYPMELMGEDAAVVVLAVNRGIDSHLEAVFGEFSWFNRTIPSGAVLATVLKRSVPKASMLTLLRRLYEFEDYECEDDMIDAAESLRSGILTTIDIEEV